MKAFTAVALWLTVAVSVSVMWVQARWPTSLPEVAAFVLAAVWAAAGLGGWVRLRVSFALIPLLGILLWAAFQMAVGATVYQWHTKVALLYWSANAAFFFVALQVSSDARWRTRLLQALVVFAFVIGIIAPVQALDPTNKVFFLFDLPKIWWIPFGPFPYTNQYAAFVELLLPFALYRAVVDQKWRTFHVVVAAVLYTSVIASVSRAGFVLTTLEMIMVPAIVLRKHRIPARMVKGAGLLFAGIFIMLAIAAGPAALLEKFSKPDPYAGRREFVESSVRMVRDRPLLGVGLGNWSTVYPSYAVFDDGFFANQAHNDWAQWTVEGGLPLLAIMLTLAIWAVPRALRTGWGSGIAVVLLHCFVDYPIQRTAVAIVFFIMLGAVATSGSRSEESVSDA